jgi:hypothetical protein
MRSRMRLLYMIGDCRASAEGGDIFGSLVCRLVKALWRTRLRRGQIRVLDRAEARERQGSAVVRSGTAPAGR